MAAHHLSSDLPLFPPMALWPVHPMFLDSFWCAPMLYANQLPIPCQTSPSNPDKPTTTPSTAVHAPPFPRVPTALSPPKVQGSDMETNQSIEAVATSLGRTDQGYRCIYCQKVYSRKYGLKIHLRTHTGFKPLKCKVCSRAFSDPSNLNKHTRLHAEQTVVRCKICGKGAARGRDLERHMVTRHPNVPREDTSGSLGRSPCKELVSGVLENKNTFLSRSPSKEQMGAFATSPNRLVSAVLFSPKVVSPVQPVVPKIEEIDNEIDVVND